MVVEVEAVEGDFFVESCLLESELDSALQPMLCFGLSELIEDEEGVAIFFFGLLDDLFEALGHDFESQADEIFFDPIELCHDRFLLLMTKASYSAREGSSRRMRLSFSCLSLTGG